MLRAAVISQLRSVGSVMKAKPAFDLPARHIRSGGNALVTAYLIVTELLFLRSRDVVERDHVLSFMLDQICRTPGGSSIEEDLLVTAALAEFGGGFPPSN
jgi:hypothetical protein